MASLTDYPAVGRLLSANDDAVVFQPQGNTYELRLATAAIYDGPLGRRIRCFIRASARKLYTVPSGGNLIVPIFGPPRILQGRVQYLDETHMVMQAGTPVIVELPKDDNAYDLAHGPLAVGALVNATIWPGVSFELLEPAAQPARR